MSKRPAVLPCNGQIHHELQALLPAPVELDSLLANLTTHYPEGVLTFGWRDGKVYAFIQSLHDHDWKHGPPTRDGISLPADYPSFTEAAGWLILKAVQE